MILDFLISDVRSNYKLELNRFIWLHVTLHLVVSL